MPKKQHLYLFGTNESFGFEINRSVTLKYLNQFVVEEESQTDIIQSYLEITPVKGSPASDLRVFKLMVMPVCLLGQLKSVAVSGYPVTSSLMT